MKEIYDKIGTNYNRTRRADPRLLEELMNQLKPSSDCTILDVGAGTGNYAFELAERGHTVTALEPARLMIENGRRHERLKWICSRAENLPMEEDRFHAAIILLSMHHFTDWKHALREVSRVVDSGPIILFTFDPEVNPDFWLFDYFPALREINHQVFPPLSKIKDYVESTIGKETNTSYFPIDRDIEDGFAGAGWCHPERYLDEGFRNGISPFSKLSEEELSSGVSRLREDLKVGKWDSRYGALRVLKSYDLGYVFLKIL